VSSIALASICAFLLLRPHFGERTQDSSPELHSEDEAIREKLERLLQMRSDLVLDFETGKISEEDYQTNLEKVAREIRFREKELLTRS
jgi:hypothetical protein